MALIQAVGYTWGMGAGSEIARLLGKQKKREAEQTLATALAGGILSGGIMAVIFIVFRDFVLRLLGATDTSLAPAEHYGLYIMLAAPVMCGAYVLNNALRAEGQPYLALLGILAGGLSNVLLDYILVIVLGLGIAGAGMATLAGQGISLVIMYICVRSRYSVIRLHMSDMWGLRYRMRIVRTGLPSFLRQGLMCLATIMISRSCRQYGDGAMAGITVANKIFAVIFAGLWAGIYSGVWLCLWCRACVQDEEITEIYHDNCGVIYVRHGRVHLGVGIQAGRRIPADLRC